jgi:signal transduction histidine kinase
MEALGMGRWWPVVVAAALWPTLFLHGSWQVALTGGYALGCLLLMRSPVGGALLVAATQAAALGIGVDPESGAGLLPALLCLTVLGRRAATPVAVPVLALYSGIIVATGLPVVRTAVGLVLFSAAWGLPHLATRRARRVRAEQARATALAQRDVQVAAADIVAAERARLVSGSLDVVRTAVADMCDMARAAATSLSSDGLAQLHARGVSATQELRGLLGLLRSDPPDAPPVASDPSRTARWPQDVAVAVAVAGTLLVELLVEGAPTDDRTVWLAVLLTAAVALRRTSPTAAVLTAAVPFVAAVALGVPLMHGLAEGLALALLTWGALTSGSAQARLAWLVMAVAAPAAGLGTSLEHGAVAGAVVITTTLGALTWRTLAHEEDLANARIEHLESTLATSVGKGLERERVAIARDLHDVVGHALGVMMIQAAAARAMARRDPGGARRALGHVVTAGRAAALELDRMGAHVDPGVNPDDLAALVNRMQGAGLVVTLDQGVPLPTGPLGLVAYRVAQEALTNAVRHAPGSHIRLAVRRGAGELQLRIDNDPGSAPRLTGGSGTGLAGLAERVGDAGGRLEAGPRGDGGFTVTAHLPVPASSDPIPEPVS